MSTLLLVHENIPELDVFTAAVKPGVEVINYDGTQAQLDTLKARTGIAKVAIAWENGLVLPEELFAGVAGPAFEGYNVLTNGLVDLVSSLAAGNSGLIFDFLSCNLNEPAFQADAGKLETDYGVNVRYSLDQTGDADAGGNWVLESDNVNVKDEYFTADIDGWDHVLLGNDDGRAGYSKISAFIKDGSVWVYGSTNGINTSTPQEVSVTDETFIQVYIIYSSVFAVTSSGKLYTISGTTATQDTTAPSDVTFFSSGASGTKAVLTSGGDVYWGGPGSWSQITSLSNIEYIDVGYATNELYAVDSDNNLWTRYAAFSNANTAKFFSDIETDVATYPDFVKVATNVKQVVGVSSYGLRYTTSFMIVLGTDGSVYTLGKGHSYLEEFHGTTSTSLRSVTVGSDITSSSSYRRIDGTSDPVTQISYSSMGFALALHESGEVSRFGLYSSTPTKIFDSSAKTSNLSGVVGVASLSTYKGFMLLDDGKLIWIGTAINGYNDLKTPSSSAGGSTAYYEYSDPSVHLVASGVTTMANTYYNPNASSSSGSSSSVTLTAETEEAAASTAGFEASEITALQATITDGASVTLDTNVASKISSATGAARRSRRKAAMRTIFANNSSVNSFATTPAAISLSSSFTKDTVNVLRPGVDISTIAYIDADSGFYVPFSSGEGIAITPRSGDTFTLGLTDASYTLTSSGSITVVTDASTMSSDGTGYLVAGDLATINGVELVMGSAQGNSESGDGSSSGDPHVFPIYGNKYELPMKKATYRMLQGENLRMNASTRLVTAEEQQAIRQYYERVNGEEAPASLISNGVFYDKVFLVADGNKFFYDFTNKKGNLTNDKYFSIQQEQLTNKADHNNKYEYAGEIQQIRVSFMHSKHGAIVLRFNHFSNPQINCGLGAQVAKTEGLSGMLVREYKSKSMRVNKLSNMKTVRGVVGTNQVLSKFGCDN